MEKKILKVLSNSINNFFNFPRFSTTFPDFLFILKSYKSFSIFLNKSSENFHDFPIYFKFSNFFSNFLNLTLNFLKTFLQFSAQFQKKIDFNEFPQISNFFFLPSFSMKFSERIHQILQKKDIFLHPNRKEKKSIK